MRTTATRLVIDIGNSGMRGARVGGARVGRGAGQPLPNIDHVQRIQWHAKSSPGHQDLAIDPADWHSLRPWLRELAGQEDADCHWWLSSVQRVASTSFVQALSAERPADTLHAVGHRDVPMAIDLPWPERLGIDRLLAAWGGLQALQGRGPAIVVQAGTAVTVDWVDSRGRFAGGAIMPGMPIALRLLAQGTDLLPLVRELEELDEVVLPGKDTQQAMQAGAAAAFLGGVAWLVGQYRTRMREPRIPVVVSGGDGPAISKWIPEPVVSVDHLVLRALAALSVG
jgi:type III pantothenate kinase